MEFEVNCGSAEGMITKGDHQRKFEKNRIERFKKYKEETSNARLSNHYHDKLDLDKRSRIFEQQKEKHLIGPLVEVQVSLEDSVHKSKRIYCNYEENFKQYGETFLEDSSENSDNSQTSKMIGKNKKLLGSQYQPFDSIDSENKKPITPVRKNYIEQNKNMNTDVS